MFKRSEDIILNNFQNKYSDIIQILYSQIDTYSQMFSTLSGLKILLNPLQAGINVFLAKNLSFLVNSFNLFSKGYVSEAHSLMRSVIEGIVYSLFFVSFPQEYEIYAKYTSEGEGYIKFTKYLRKKYKKDSSYTDLLLELIDENANLLTEKESSFSFKKNISIYISEFSKFIHSDIMYAVGSLFLEDKNDGSKMLALGPKEIGEEFVIEYFATIIHVLGFTFFTFERAIPVEGRRNLDPLFQKVKEKAKESQELLKKWKETIKN